MKIAETRTGMDRRLVAAMVAVFLLAAVFHGRAWLQYRSDPFAVPETYVSDELSYHRWALRIAENGLAEEPVFHQSPLFPLLLSQVYDRAPPETRTGWGILLQSLLLAAAIALLVPVGRLYFDSDGAGLAAALLALFHGPFVFYALKLLPVSLALATQAAALVTLALARRSPGPVAVGAAGLAWALACLARAELVLFLPLAVVGLARAPGGRPLRRRLVAAGGFLVAVAVVIAPVTLHNVRRGDVVLIGSAAGENLFIGNQIEGSGGYKALHPKAGDIFSQRAAAKVVAEREEGRSLLPSEISAYWRGRAFEEISGDFGGWLALEARKLGRILHPGDPTDIYSFALERSEYLPALYPLALTPWSLILLAAIGAAAAWRRTPSQSWPLAAFLGLHAIVLLIFFVDSRLRLPFFFFLCPFGGFAVVEGLRLWRAGRRRLVASSLLILTVSLAWGTLATKPKPRDVVRLAAVLSRQQRLDESLAVLAPVVSSPNPDPYALDQAGWVLQKKGDYAAARDRYIEALERGSGEHRQTRSRLAMVYEKLGEIELAAAEHDAAVASDNANAGTYFERGMFRMRRGEGQGARRDLLQAARLDPGWPAPRAALRSLGVEPP